MSTISQIELPSGSVYDLEDSAARADIENLKTTAIGGVHYRGNVKEALTDGATTSPVTIVSTNAEGSSIETSLTPAAGDIVNVAANNKAYAWNGKQWDLWGTAGEYKALAYKDNASGSITPSGSVSQPTFTGTKATISATYTPAGSVAVTPNVQLNTTPITPMNSVGTLPSFTTTVTNKKLTLGWDAGTLATKGSAVTVATSIKSQTASATFTGTSGTAIADYTPTGTVSKPTFTGSSATVTVK